MSSVGEVGGRAEQLMRLVHERPGTSRAEAAQRLGTSSGATSDLVAALGAARLLAEGEPARRGPGRPTRPLVAHPRGPLVLGVAVTHEGWRVAAVELGGRTVAEVAGSHDGQDPVAVLAAVRAAGERLDASTGLRVRGWGVAAPGLVDGGRHLDAPQLGWHGVDLHAVRPGGSGALVVAGNDATLSAAGEALRGSGTAAHAHLHLLLDAGIGGALVRDGVPDLGAHGLAGEFGHVPFGDPSRACRCGASGCWGEELGGAALARALGAAPPTDPVAFAGRVLADAAAGHREALAAARVVATALGRGVGGLVNALDPDLVTLGGFGPALLDVAGDRVREACAAGVVRRRAVSPPPVVAAALGSDGALVGAAEVCWARVLPALVAGGGTA